MLVVHHEGFPALLGYLLKLLVASLLILHFQYLSLAEHWVLLIKPLQADFTIAYMQFSVGWRQLSLT